MLCQAMEARLLFLVLLMRSIAVEVTSLRLRIRPAHREYRDRLRAVFFDRIDLAQSGGLDGEAVTCCSVSVPTRRPSDRPEREATARPSIHGLSGFSRAVLYAVLYLSTRISAEPSAMLQQ